jgi:hypothetical protein
MSNEHPYRPCPSCGGVEFDSLPDLAFELYNASTVMGLAAMSKISGGLLFTLVVCSGCGKTDMYTKNAAKVAERCKGATHFRAASQGPRLG